jgi:GTP-binding protein
MFIDTAKVEIRAGKGGNGAVSFRHEIYIPKGGPDGGNGGKGGDVVFQASKDENTLLGFRYSPLLYAKDGGGGSGRQSAGRSGEDLIVKVPVGTIVRRMDTGEQIADLVADGEQAIIAHGGDGGFGNAHFKSSTRQTPKFAELGEPGEEFTAELELRLLADIGLLGLPNAGKSTFLSVVSNARPEIADYPFTTIVPNLGVATIDDYDILIADIPGLIEGAADGKGLGDAFLRHVERNAALLHLVDIYSDDAGEAYQTIRNELQRHSAMLAAKPEIVALTKCEGVDQDIISMQTASILAINPAAQVYTISSTAHQGITEVLRALKSIIETAKADVQARGRAAEVSSRSGDPQLRRGPSESARDDGPDERPRENMTADGIPIISLPDQHIDDNRWTIEKSDNIFIVRGKKIEKFAIRTNLDNWASVNRLRDILKKLGIHQELTRMGAQHDSIISIAGREFTLVEQ